MAEIPLRCARRSIVERYSQGFRQPNRSGEHDNSATASNDVITESRCSERHCASHSAASGGNNMTTTNPKSVNRGVVVTIRGSVVDIRFDEHLPSIYSVLLTELFHNTVGHQEGVSIFCGVGERCREGE